MQKVLNNILFLDGSCFTFFPSLESLGCAHVSLFSIIFHAFFSVPDNFQSRGVNGIRDQSNGLSVGMGLSQGPGSLQIFLSLPFTLRVRKPTFSGF